MGLLEGVINKAKWDLEYKAGSEVSSGVAKAAKGLMQKGSKCPKCGAPITDASLKFCAKCGAKLTVACAKCKADYPLGTKFCTKCGKALK